MPFLPPKRRSPGTLASGALLALSLAIGCAPAPGGGGGPNQPGANRTPVPTTNPTAGPTTAPSPSPTSTTSQTTVSFATQVAPLLQARCAACHTGAGVGGVSLFTEGGSPRYDNIRTHLPNIITQVANGTMPQGGPRFTQSEVGLLTTWRDNGAPNN